MRWPHMHTHASTDRNRYLIVGGLGLLAIGLVTYLPRRARPQPASVPLQSVPVPPPSSLADREIRAAQEMLHRAPSDVKGYNAL